MIIKEVKKFQFCNQTYVILENREKIQGRWCWVYWITIRGYGSMANIFGLFEKPNSYEEVVAFVFDHFDSFYEEITGECFEEVQERLKKIKEVNV